tara:strand:+ start:1699 stop:1974 length:276 start_codon:yes stop_codon:yes gene_type:complete
MKSEDSEKNNSICQRYEQQVSYILQILGEEDESFKYSIIWDDTSFRDLSVSPQQLINLSNVLKVQVYQSMLVCDCARFMFNNKLDIQPDLC